MKQATASLAMLMALTSCASIVSGSTQNIKLSTDPQAVVTCDAKNSRGVWRSNNMPGEILVKRSKSDLLIDCEGAEYSGKFTEKADIEGWFFGNILIGGLVGVIVDPATGAMFSYNDEIKVPLVSKYASQAQPAIGGSSIEPAPAAAQAPAVESTTTTTTTTTTQQTMPVAAPTTPAPQPQRLMTYDELVRSGAIVEAPKAK